MRGNEGHGFTVTDCLERVLRGQGKGEALYRQQYNVSSTRDRERNPEAHESLMQALQHEMHMQSVRYERYILRSYNVTGTVMRMRAVRVGRAVRA